jgi:hypothetical protein
MGLDARDMPTVLVDEAVKSLRSSGFDVTVKEIEPPNGNPNHYVRHVYCHRHKDSITLSFSQDLQKPESTRIYIPNAWSWWPPRSRRLQAIQKEVTAAIELAGGVFPR